MVGAGALVLVGTLWRPWEAAERRSGDEVALLSLGSETWGAEREAQKYQQGYLVPFWNELKDAKNKAEVLAEVPFEKIVLGALAGRRRDDLGVLFRRFEAGGPSLGPTAWGKRLRRLRDDGYRIGHTHWYHEDYVPAADGGPRSTVRFEIQATRGRKERVRLRGLLEVTWRSTDDGPAPGTVRVKKATVARHEGQPGFREATSVDVRKLAPRRDGKTGALAVYDLNRDGRPEILLGGPNRVLWNQGGDFDVRRLCGKRDAVFAALAVADFTGDGYPDLFGVGTDRVPQLYVGTEDGRFPAPPKRVTAVEPLTGVPACVSVADVDSDGDLDAFVGQWRSLFRGQVDGKPRSKWPERYFNSRDGHPNHILLNNGNGTFEPSTDASGLGRERYRRTFSASFFDYDRDGAPDLLTTNDFAGVRLYHNDGRGHFTDVTERLLDRWHMFGMSHTFGDYNGDGRLDFFAIGMSSPTVRRLERLGVGPPGVYTERRAAMAYGNRMYLATPDGGYRQAPFNDQVARTNWSWGSTTFDFDNDRDDDVYVATGHTSGRSVRNYGVRFWTRDVYETDAEEGERITNPFLAKLRKGEVSWDGYLPNALFVNRGGSGFDEVASVLGLGADFDGRNVVSTDLDRDGRMDLLVVEAGSPRNEGGAVVHYKRNVWPDAGKRHWVGLRLQEAITGHRPYGARVTLHAGGREQVRLVTTGDSYMAAHPPVVHFGLGDVKEIRVIEVAWPDGTTHRIEHPPIDRYLTVRPEGTDGER